jgi:antitoxin ParD1/3/4
MNVSLTPELEAFVAHEVNSGQYASNSEVLREGLRLLQRQQELLRSAIRQGLASPVRSATEVTLDTIRARAKAKR